MTPPRGLCAGKPWIIYGVMRTRDAVTPAGDLRVSLVGFTLLYVLLGGVLITLLRFLARRTGPREA